MSSTPICSGCAGSPSATAAQAPATARPFGVAGSAERGGGAELLCQPRRPSHRRGRRGPTRSGRRASPGAIRSPSCSRTASSAEPGAAWIEPAAPTVTTSAPARRAARSQRSTTGARSSTGSSPITTTRSAPRIEERGARSGSSAVLACSGSTTASESSPSRTSRDSASACSTVSEPESASSTGPLRSSRSASSSAASHDSSSKRRLPSLPERVAHAVGRVEVREAEAALVAEPALVDLGMVAREDPLDLPLAGRRA